MTTQPSIKDLRNLSDELELFGIPPLPLNHKKNVNALDDPGVQQAVIESLWKLMAHQWQTNQSNKEEEEVNRCLKRDNERLTAEIVALKKKLSTARDNSTTLLEHDKARNKAAAASERTEKRLRRDVDALQARLESAKASHEQQVKRRDAEIAELGERAKRLALNGTLRAPAAPRVKSSSEREALLKQVVCKYQEMNQALVEENLSLCRTIAERKNHCA